MKGCRRCPRVPVHAAGKSRRFTVADANRALVLVKRVVEDLVFLHARMLDVEETVEAAEDSGAERQWEIAREQLLDVVEHLRICVGELDDIGVELKDWGRGLVDFPSVLEGREIRLCWQLGEPEITYWHEIDADERRPIETLPMSAKELVGLLR